MQFSFKQKAALVADFFQVISSRQRKLAECTNVINQFSPVQTHKIEVLEASTFKRRNLRHETSKPASTKRRKEAPRREENHTQSIGSAA